LIGLLCVVVDRYLGANQLSGTIPSVIGQLTALTVLYASSFCVECDDYLLDRSLHNNQLSGTIPSVIGQLTMLNYLLAS
jgi:hypothetical protein